jgi:hypothetical protein
MHSFFPAPYPKARYMQFMLSYWHLCSKNSCSCNSCVNAIAVPDKL